VGGVVVTAVVVPVCEELFFRGVLIPGLVGVSGRRWLAVVVSAIGFGLVHVGGGEGPQVHVVPAMTVFGVLAGVAFLRSGGLAVPIGMHVLFNGKTLLWETIKLWAG